SINGHHWWRTYRKSEKLVSTNISVQPNLGSLLVFESPLNPTASNSFDNGSIVATESSSWSAR
ncbi:hypothetical protein ACHAXS_001830, partial [Conticribra weissflogii]